MSRRGKEAGRQPMSSASTTPCASGWGSLCARPCPSPSATRCIGAASNCSCTATISVVYDRSLSHYQKLLLEVAAAKSGMDPKTARKYLQARRLPSEMRPKRTWQTRPDPFAEIWEEIRQLLTVEPGLQAKTLFEHLQK